MLSPNDCTIEGKSGDDMFIITMANGTKYIFTAKENTLNRTSGAGHDIPKTSITGWFLTKIIDKNNQEVNIEYNTVTYNNIINQSQTMIFTPPGLIQYIYDKYNILKPFYRYPSIGSMVSSYQYVTTQQISRIYNDKYGEIKFNYEQSENFTDVSILKEIIQKNYQNKILNHYALNYLKTDNERLFLNEVKMLTSDNKYVFEYYNHDLFPKRLDYGRDIWGYYNGARNVNLIPKLDTPLLEGAIYVSSNQEINKQVNYYGLLKKIVYPTGGYSEISYEPNKTVGNKTIPPVLTGKSAIIRIGEFEENGIREKVIEIIANKDEYIHINGSGSFNSTCDSNLNVPKKHIGTLSAVDEEGNAMTFCTQSFNFGYVNIGTQCRFSSEDGNNYYLYVKKGQKYIFTFRANFECTKTAVYITYTLEDEKQVQAELLTGGLRVNEIKDYSLNSNESPITKKYIYKDENAIFSNAKVVREPLFIDQHYNVSYNYVTRDEITYYYMSLTSNNINQLYSFHPNIFYKTVIEEIPNKGKIIHKFNTSTDYFPKTLVGEGISNANWTNFGANNGKEIATTYFDKSDNKLREILYNYSKDAKGDIPALSIRKKYDFLYPPKDYLKTCTKDMINKQYEYRYCAADHRHTWSISFDCCIASGNINLITKINTPCYGKEEGATIIFSNIFENLDIVQYKNISYFTPLESQTTTDYINGKELKSTTEYFHNNPTHYQLTSQTTTFPDNSVQKTSYQYAHEKGNQYLIDKNMVGIPLQTTVTKTTNGVTKTLSDVETKYPTSQTEADSKTTGLALPYEVWSKDFQGNTSKEVLYKNYDDKGNLREYVLNPDTNGNGTPVAIIWGYNNTQPIAKIEGATYGQVQNEITNIVLASEKDNNPAAYSMSSDEAEINLRNELDEFRKKTNLSNYQITTYTYDPLIGVTSITPPSGIREIYQYDSANRLEKVVDMNGNILKEYEYHYKQ